MSSFQSGGLAGTPQVYTVHPFKLESFKNNIYINIKIYTDSKITMDKIKYYEILNYCIIFENFRKQLQDSVLRF